MQTGKMRQRGLPPFMQCGKQGDPSSRHAVRQAALSFVRSVQQSSMHPGNQSCGPRMQTGKRSDMRTSSPAVLPKSMARKSAARHGGPLPLFGAMNTGLLAAMRNFQPSKFDLNTTLCLNAGQDAIR